MSRFGFGRGVLVAAVLALVAAGAFSALAGLMTASVLLKAIVVCVHGGYLLTLTSRTKLRRGRLALPLLWVLAVTAISFAASPAISFVISHAVLLWVTRSLMCHKTLVAAALDLILTGVAVVVAMGAARHSGSMLLSVWSFLLVQAFAAFIPEQLNTSTTPLRGKSNNDFERAHAQAQAALRRLANNH